MRSWPMRRLHIVAISCVLLLFAVAHGSAAQGGAVCGALAQVPAARLPASALGPAFQGATVISTGDTWAVGDYYDDLNNRTSSLIEHWDGRAWTKVPSVDPGAGQNTLNDVAAASSSDVWAVGYEGPLVGVTPDYTLIEHWDGQAWEVVPSPNPSDVGINFLWGVVAIDASHAWSVGTYDTGQGSLPLLERWDGTVWTAVSGPDVATYHDLYGVAGVLPDDVWAVGDHGTPPAPDQTLILHWDGSSWRVVPSPNVGSGHNILEAVAALAADDVWAVGYYFAGSSTFTLTEHWDGNSWKVVPSPNPFSDTNELFGVSAVAPGDVWASGITGPAPSSMLLHWDGTAWASLPVPDTSLLNRLDDVAAAAGGELWTVGETAMGSPNPRAYTARICPVIVRDNGFTPPRSVGTEGGTVDWTFDPANSQSHEVVDGSLGLFNSGQKAPGTSFAFTFESAGTYLVVDPIHVESSKVLVPAVATPKSGGVGTQFTISWSAKSAKPGFVFDVQIKRPGSTEFVDWMTDQIVRTSTFAPDSGTGTYSFRARLRDASNGNASGYSPPVSIAVH